LDKKTSVFSYQSRNQLLPIFLLLWRGNQIETSLIINLLYNIE